MFQERRAITISIGILAVSALLVSFSANQYYNDFSSDKFADLNEDLLNLQEEKQESFFDNFSGSINLKDTIEEPQSDTLNNDTIKTA